jgi:CO/xanthine dehydrogenase Mo-binding subunit
LPEPLPQPIGAPLPRPRARRLLAGRGRYTDDLSLPRMLHVAFVRSPHAHAGIGGIETAAAETMPGVVRVVAGAELARVCAPWQARHAALPALASPPQHALAIDRACWQGEPVVAVVAASRAQAEDAVERLEIDWQPLPAVADPEAALQADAPLLHPELASNLSFETLVEAGEVDAAFAAAAHVVEERFSFARHTGVPLEARTVLADYDPSSDSLTVYQSHQAPHQQQDIYAHQLGIPEHRVRVVCPDVGGAFGIKLQLYGDEIAACALAKLLGRPVKFQADRVESFLADIQAREHRVTARMALDADGCIQAVEVDEVFPIGPYSQYPRCSLNEGNHVIRLVGVPYAQRHHRGRLRIVFQNKGMVGHYRAVGHPIAYAVSERLVEAAAARLGLDALELRRRNYLAPSVLPYRTPSGITLDGIRPLACQEALVEAMDYAALRRQQAMLRADGIHRGIGFAAFVELTAPGPEGYGAAGIRVSTQDGAIVKLEPSGKVRCTASITEQGQGSEAALAQIVAGALGLALDDVEVMTGDSAASPYGGGAWASRGMAIGGEAAWRAARALAENVLGLAGALLQLPVESLSLREGAVHDTSGPRLGLAEIAEIATFRQHQLPPGTQPELTVARHYVPAGGSATAGMQAAHLEVDPETGRVRLLKLWVAYDAGTVINPLLVEEQIRGGAVQGIGAALFEECRYDADGQLLNASLADYLVPMAAEMPDIEVIDVGGAQFDPQRLGARGVGETGTAGAPAAILNAINDAIRPLGGSIATLPATPERIVRALRAGRNCAPLTCMPDSSEGTP